MSGTNIDLWQRQQQDGSNGCDNIVEEPSWIGDSVSNCNSSGKTTATVEAHSWLTGPVGSGGKEAAATSIQQQRWRSKLGLAETVGRL